MLILLEVALLKENGVPIQSIHTAQIRDDSSDDDISLSALVKRPHTPKLNITFEGIICIQRHSRTAKAPPLSNAQQATVTTTTSSKDEVEERQNKGNVKAKGAVKRQITSNKAKSLRNVSDLMFPFCQL
ncbi:hypothetical protein QE152_g6237 [Popillia japonica]|uniref:Uncharacterized protein n=1 Tax=Popillia japonica TaxID=7064 RepID=A0AAW1MIZ4_POPJA